MDILIGNSRAIVSDINGSPECLVLSFSGDIDYLGEKLSFSCIGGVTTSLIARKQQLAGRLTATRIALDAMDGHLVSGLGIFDQGYYDKLGYGTGSYEYIAKFSPATLDVSPPAEQGGSKGGSLHRIPIRITPEDWESVYQSRINRMRWHGSCNILLPEQTQAEMLWAKGGHGYGYKNDAGELTHFIFMDGLGKEQGPFWVEMMAFQSYEQLIELLSLLKSFGDQVHIISMVEPPGIQLQDFFTKPFLHRSITEGSKFQNLTRASAFWQLRICDLAGCMEKTHLSGETVRFNLHLTDPIEKYLDDDIEWRGVGGDYVVTLGEESSAVLGNKENLPTMTASVNAFTRMWMGVLPASSLTMSGELSAPIELLGSLDRLLRLPQPKVDWMF